MERQSHSVYQNRSGERISHRKSPRISDAQEAYVHGSWNETPYVNGNTHTNAEAVNIFTDFGDSLDHDHSSDSGIIVSVSGDGHRRNMQPAASGHENGLRLSHAHAVNQANMYSHVNFYPGVQPIGVMDNFGSLQSMWPHPNPAFPASVYYAGGPVPAFHLQPQAVATSSAFENAASDTTNSFGMAWPPQPDDASGDDEPIAASKVTDVGKSGTAETSSSGGKRRNSGQRTASSSKKSDPALISEEPGSPTEAPELDPSSECTPGSSEDGNDTGSPRDEELLQQDPRYSNPVLKPDGKYHCPFAEDEDCGHVPTRHRCYYDKYIDSHLKPYRCKAPECEDLRFSSSACRVRHEREAHGSHGHGLKPYHCLYPDCDRAKEGNGFPRLWNRNDHMKRVHDHPPTASPQGKGLEEEAEEGKGRKRRKSSPGNEDRSKRPKVPTEKEVQGEKLLQMSREWISLHAQLHETWHNLRGPLDIETVKRLHQESSQLLSNANKILKVWQGTGGELTVA